VVTGGADAKAAAVLPAFSVRVSRRARHVRLIVDGAGQLVVVVPQRFDHRAIPTILDAKQDWIERARRRALSQGPWGRAAEPFPTRIVLPATGEDWEVEYRPSPTGGPNRRGATAVARESPGRRLVVSAAAGDEDACRRALARWLQRRARSVLVPWLERLGEQHGLHYGRVSVRHQRTRWASCSRRRGISLNLRLLFLDAGLVDYVLLHELCHTRELNHSRRFWALLQSYDSDCAAHRRQAREAWRSLPGWLESRDTPR
jgi:predicted metal-dependent hydrolase